jgi:hypothetical protein
MRREEKTSCFLQLPSSGSQIDSQSEGFFSSLYIYGGKRMLNESTQLSFNKIVVGKEREMENKGWMDGWE